MTLVEIMLGLALAGLLLLTARALFDELVQVEATLGRVARAQDAKANATHVLYALVRHADVRPDSLSRFIGDSASVQFRSVCQQPGGWLTSCSVLMLVDAGRDSTTLSAQLSTGEVLTLGSWAGHGSLRYVGASGDETRWLSAWGTSIVPPIAMALVLDRDTIALPLAGR